MQNRYVCYIINGPNFNIHFHKKKVCIMYIIPIQYVVLSFQDK